MLKRELKINLKNFIIWTSILILMFLVVFLIYPYIITGENIASINEMMTIFPKEVLKAFNMDISSIDTAYGWLKTEGFIFTLLIIGVYSSMLGSNILLKEENDKTIEYLNSLPIARKDILLDKIICGVTYILLMTFIIGIFNYVCLTLSGDFDSKQYILLSITPIFIALPLFSGNLLISTFFHKTKKTIGISLGIVFVSYFLQILSELDEIVNFLKYFTVYSLADTRNIIQNTNINPILIVTSLLLTTIFIALSFIKYENKELV